MAPNQWSSNHARSQASDPSQRRRCSFIRTISGFRAHSSGGLTAITLALDLRLVVSPHRGTGLRPNGYYTRYMNLSGTVNGVQITSGSGLSDVMVAGRYRRFLPPPRRATPFNWYGTNGSVQFCTH